MVAPSNGRTATERSTFGAKRIGAKKKNIFICFFAISSKSKNRRKKKSPDFFRFTWNGEKQIKIIFCPRSVISFARGKLCWVFLPDLIPHDANSCCCCWLWVGHGTDWKQYPNRDNSRKWTLLPHSRSTFDANSIVNICWRGEHGNAAHRVEDERVASRRQYLLRTNP